MAGLLNALQAASNVTAENVSFPVDALAWVLRKAGLPIPANPIMGSDWMREKGLTAPVQPGWSRVAGETAGLVGPAVVSQFGPQIARGLLKGGENLAAPANVSKGYSAGQRGIFMGDQSKTWNKEAASKARQMDKAGVDPKKIWEETGTFKGPDGKWRQEIDDSAAMFNTSTIDGVKRENDLLRGAPDFDFGPINGLLDHDQLKAAYGNGLTKSTFVGNKNTMLGDGVQGSYDQATGALTINAPAKAADARSTVLHELQHAVQQREGFARGGSPAELARNLPDEKAINDAQVLRAIVSRGAAPENAPAEFLNMMGRDVHPAARDLMFESDDALKAMYPHEQYRRLAGEAEARAVQTRMGMDAATRRQVFPLSSYDVPVEQLIVRGGSGDALSILERNGQGLLDEAPKAKGLMSMTPTKYDASAPKVADGFVRLFRAESPTTKFDDVFDKGGLSEFASAKDGTRFTDDFKYADYFRSSYGKDAQLKYLDVPKEMAEAGRINGYEFKIPLDEAPKARGLMSGPARGQRGAIDLGMPDGARRMEIAQRNAAKPVSEGGLGLGPNNTAQERATAMGFGKDAFHGTDTEFRVPSRDVFASEAPSIANRYAFRNSDDGLVMPLLVSSEAPTFEHLGAQSFRIQPSQARSRFAAFDPARRNEADLLGGADPYLLALLGLGAGGAAWYGQE